MRKIYDQQKSRVSKATFGAFEDYNDDSSECAMSREELFELLETIKSSEYFSKHNGNPGLSLRVQSIPQDCYGLYVHNYCAIALSHDVVDSRVLCHEIAHHLTYQIAPDLPHHGPTFCTHFLNLMTLFVGRDLSRTLRHSFDEFEVDYILENIIEFDLMRAEMGIEPLNHH